MTILCNKCTWLAIIIPSYLNPDSLTAHCSSARTPSYCWNYSSEAKGWVQFSFLHSHLTFVFVISLDIFTNEDDFHDILALPDTPEIEQGEKTVQGLPEATGDQLSSVNESAHSVGNDEIADIPTEVQERMTISLHRSNLKKELISLFDSERVLNRFLEVKMINDHRKEEKGEGSGVVRDALSLFWQDAYVSLMLGEDERVPCIRHDMGRNHWEAVL